MFMMRLIELDIKARSAASSPGIETGSPATRNSDGILLVRERGNIHSGLLLSFRNGSPVTAVPADYTAVPVD